MLSRQEIMKDFWERRDLIDGLLERYKEYLVEDREWHCICSCSSFREVRLHDGSMVHTKFHMCGCNVFIKSRNGNIIEFTDNGFRFNMYLEQFILCFVPLQP